MKTTFWIWIMLVTFTMPLVGCGKPEPDLDTRTPEQQEAFKELYRGMDQPTDRSKSKEY